MMVFVAINGDIFATFDVFSFFNHFIFEKPGDARRARDQLLSLKNKT